MDFIRKQSIDILAWKESAGGTLAWRFPVAGNEVRYGASLTVRESRLAVFVAEPKRAQRSAQNRTEPHRTAQNRRDAQGSAEIRTGSGKHFSARNSA